MIKVNFGSGDTPYPDWINIDLDRAFRPDVLANLAKPLPLTSGSVDYIFTEDFVVQLPYRPTEVFFRECHRILKPGGIMRLLLPDLEKLIDAYFNRPDWLVAMWRQYVDVPLELGTACEAVNLAMQMAGEFHFDRQTLLPLLRQCGFEPYEVAWRESEFAPLRGLDQRHPDRSISMHFECRALATESGE